MFSTCKIRTVHAFRHIVFMVVASGKVHAPVHKAEAVLRRFATAILCVFALVVGFGTRQAPAQDGVVTFKFTNEAKYTIYMKMYSQNRNHVWPSDSTHYVLDDSDERTARLACRVGEKICYGGAYRTDGTGSYWGTGYKGNKACRGCCLTCGTEDDDVSYSWTLTD